MLPFLLACVDDPGFDVLLISLDGASYALVEEEWDALTTLPEIAAGGSFQPAEIVGVPNTLASHAKILSGYEEDVTGMVSAHEWTQMEKGMSIHERVRDEFGEGMNVYWVSNKPHMLGINHDTEPFWHASEVCDVAINKEMSYNVTPHMLDSLRGGGGRPFFGFFHWSGLDRDGHIFGERSAEQRETLHEIDADLGSVVAELKALGRWERTRIYVTADHGFDPLQTTHATDASHVFVITNDPDIGTATYVHQLPWTLYRNYGIKVDDFPAPVEAM